METDSERVQERGIILALLRCRAPESQEIRNLCEEFNAPELKRLQPQPSVNASSADCASEHAEALAQAPLTPCYGARRNLWEHPMTNPRLTASVAVAARKSAPQDTS